MKRGVSPSMCSVDDSSFASPSEIFDSGSISSVDEVKISDIDSQYMEIAFTEARQALSNGEVPVGCVFVLDHAVICRGSNATNERLTGEAHAEMRCIDEILDTHPDVKWNCVTLYVTVEPCIMCAAALKILGVGKIVFGCRNPRFGGMGTVLDAMSSACGCPAPETVGLVRAPEAVDLLKIFYAGTNPSAPKDKVKKRKIAPTLSTDSAG